MYSNIKVYQKYLVTSIKVGCATRSLYASSGPKAEGVPTNNQRGRGSGPCRLWGGLDKARHIVPTALLVRVQRFRNDLYKAVKGPSTRPIVLSMMDQKEDQQPGGGGMGCSSRLYTIHHLSVQYCGMDAWERKRGGGAVVRDLPR